MERYSMILEKGPREMVLLRGKGCKWKQCTFCDYHLDASDDEAENVALNHSVLQRVTGQFHHLEVINSGSFMELGEETMAEIMALCKEKEIHTLHFECHYLYRNQIPALREAFAAIGVTLKLRIGVETFDADFRERVMKKGIKETDPTKIAEYFDECCLLFGLTGQTVESMKRDVETGLKYFERICINIMVENTTDVKPDQSVIDDFLKEIYPQYRDNERVDILLNNTDYGVGGEEHE